jgi:molybdopterin-guanine dinucleotide biosynthesis protein A
MEVAGEVWWRRQQRALARLDLRQIWVISPQVEEALAEADDAPDSRHIGDPEAPPFDSLLVGLRALTQHEQRDVFVLPVDVPCPQRAVWQALCGPDGPTVPANHDVRGHPPYLPWEWATKHILDAGPEAPRRLDHLLRDHAVEIEVVDPRVTLNLNRPADVERYRTLLEEEGQTA